MSEWQLETKNLSVGYHGKAMIHDIALGIGKGEIVTLIGPNGAGKSTILKSLFKQLRLVTGTVWIGGADVAQMSYKELSTRMAVMLTERVRTELMTCREIVATGRYPYTGRMGLLTAEDEEIVQNAMEIMRVEDLADKDFNRISDGQRQRILLSRAFCQQPGIIVLDEPTAYLDIRYKLELLDILRHMAREKQITVVMSLHEIDLAQKISDKVICVRGDTIFRCGPPEEIFRDEEVRWLYDLGEDAYDVSFGSVELPRPEGEPEVFVIAGGGSGIPVYRKLQREGVPFCTGILDPGDVDCRLARHLAARVITEKPFCAIRDATLREALEAMRRCRRVIDAGAPVGECNRRITELIEAAKKDGLLETAGEEYR